MKIAKNIVTISFILLAINVSSAQYGNSGMNGGGMNRMGGQGMNNGNSNNTGKSPGEIEKERLENLNKSMNKLVTELKLDDLQIIVIRKEFESSSKSIHTITKAEISNEEKIKQIETINEKTDRTINTFLNTEQKVKYKKIVDERKERMEKYRLSIQN